MLHASATRDWRNNDNWRRNDNGRPNSNGNASIRAHNQSQNALTMNLGRFLVTKEYADCILLTQPEYPGVPQAYVLAHRVILSCQSEQLIAHFSDPRIPMAVAADGRARPAWRAPPGWRDIHVLAMVDFFYTGRYQPPQMPLQVSFHIDMVFRASGLGAEWLCLYAFQQVLACSRKLGHGTWDPLVEEAIWRFLNNEHKEYRYDFRFKGRYQIMFDDIRDCWVAHQFGSLDFI